MVKRRHIHRTAVSGIRHLARSLFRDPLDISARRQCFCRRDRPVSPPIHRAFPLHCGPARHAAPPIALAVRAQDSISHECRATSRCRTSGQSSRKDMNAALGVAAAIASSPAGPKKSSSKAVTQNHKVAAGAASGGRKAEELLRRQRRKRAVRGNSLIAYRIS
jgi:hypothetical protein